MWNAVISVSCRDIAENLWT